MAYLRFDISLIYTVQKYKIKTKQPKLLSDIYKFGYENGGYIKLTEICLYFCPYRKTLISTKSNTLPGISFRTGKYFAVNCGAIPEGTIDSELFGHEKGSFTGANEMRKGYFEEADGGTLFLDEIGELPLASQAKLLRVLQSGEFIRVGSSKVLKTDVRVVAATNVNLMHAVSMGKFREDLYYRLNAVPVFMPALRERQDDIYLLFRKFTSDFSEKYGMNKVSLTPDAVALLKSYRWPGNIRQLKNGAETVTALESGKLTPASGRCEVGAEVLSRYTGAVSWLRTSHIWIGYPCSSACLP